MDIGGDRGKGCKKAKKGETEMNLFLGAEWKEMSWLGKGVIGVLVIAVALCCAVLDLVDRIGELRTKPLERA